MSLVTLGAPEQRQRKAVGKEVKLEEVVAALGYPESWTDVIRASLAANRKTFRWERVSDTEER
jgi:hypothetical protein